jgi:gas vesicle protein
MNVLQLEIKESFKPSLIRHDRWTDSDGIIHEEHLMEMQPYCSGMEQLAGKLALSKSQTYRLLKSPTRSFSRHEVEEIHKQLHWKKRSLDNSISIPLATTKELIMRALQQTQEAPESYIEHLEATRGDLAQSARPSQAGRSVDIQRMMKMKLDANNEKIREQGQRIKDQDELIKRLLSMSERQQDLLENLGTQIFDLQRAEPEAPQSTLEDLKEQMIQALAYDPEAHDDDEEVT